MVRIRFAETITEIDAAMWDACVGGRGGGAPFLCHAFLAALEESGSVSARTGWQPHHVLVFEEQHGGSERLIGCAPCYIKSHSRGEYVFDYEWAEAWMRTGQAYYPKLLVAIPFTPVRGPRLAIAPEAKTRAHMLKAEIGHALGAECREKGWSSGHVLFADDGDITSLCESGWLIRHSWQFHWHNRGYKHFDDFLSTLSARKRKSIRKERRLLQEQGLRFHRLTGEQLRAPEIWDFFWQCYTDTYDRKWGGPYLTREFFTRIAETMAERILLVVAEDASGCRISAALNFLGEDAIYGRHWGALQTYPCLHFETCYYQAIEHAIATGHKRVEAGTQGEHKLKRGYEPVLMKSAHFLAHPGFRNAVKDFLEHERTAIEHAMTQWQQATPFRADTHETAESSVMDEA